MIEGHYSVERLVHFRCGVCGRWWSIGDAPPREEWFCPWCGQKQKMLPPELNSDLPPEVTAPSPKQ